MMHGKEIARLTGRPTNLGTDLSDDHPIIIDFGMVFLFAVEEYKLTSTTRSLCTKKYESLLGLG